MALVRKILLAAEQRPAGRPPPTTVPLRIDGYDNETVAKHLEMMHEKGLIVANIFTHSEAGGALWGSVTRITWDGYDFLELARNDGVWTKALARLRNYGPGITVELLKIALREATKNLPN